MAVQPHKPTSSLATGRKFSIRHLLLVTAVVGVWCGLYQLAPHIAIFVSGLLIAGFATHCWLTVRLRPISIGLRMIVVLFVLSSWAYLYVLCIGPARVLTSEHQDRSDIVQVFAPIGWLHANTPLREPLQRYCELWN
jgi:hypothetical protein